MAGETVVGNFAATRLRVEYDCKLKISSRFSDFLFICSMCAIFRLSIVGARCNPIVYLLSTLSLDLYTSRYDLMSLGGFGWGWCYVDCGWVRMQMWIESIVLRVSHLHNKWKIMVRTLALPTCSSPQSTPHIQFCRIMKKEFRNYHKLIFVVWFTGPIPKLP